MSVCLPLVSCNLHASSLFSCLSSPLPSGSLCLLFPFPQFLDLHVCLPLRLIHTHTQTHALRSLVSALSLQLPFFLPTSPFIYFLYVCWRLSCFPLSVSSSCLQSCSRPPSFLPISFLSDVCSGPAPSPVGRVSCLHTLQTHTQYNYIID